MASHLCLVLISIRVLAMELMLMEKLMEKKYITRIEAMMMMMMMMNLILVMLFIAVGYDSKMEIRDRGKTQTGALRIRNSYGDGKKQGEKGWGDEGYGWLSYDYILKGFAKEKKNKAVDSFFCLIDTEFLHIDSTSS